MIKILMGMLLIAFGVCAFLFMYGVIPNPLPDLVHLLSEPRATSIMTAIIIMICGGAQITFGLAELNTKRNSI